MPQSVQETLHASEILLKVTEPDATSNDKVGMSTNEMTFKEHKSY